MGGDRWSWAAAWTLAVTGLAMGACVGEPSENADDGTGAQNESETAGGVTTSASSTTSTSSSTSSDPSSPATSDTPADVPDGDPVEVPTGTVRFVAMGDGGEGNDAQYLVADVVEQVCEERGCDLVVYLGDNFYDVGVTSDMDTQFQDKFEMPYADLALPFFVTLGNHDYGTLGNEWLKSQYQIDYSQYSDKWVLPSEYYTFDEGHVRFVGLDTARMFWDHDIEGQRDMLRASLEEVGDTKFTIAFGHHPYVSNGAHGNAGNYEGIPVPLVGGGYIKDFFDEEVCGKVHVYFSGHDHNLQWHPQPEACATHFLVSGAAAKTKGFDHRDGNPATLYEDATTPGFAWVEIVDATMTVAFYDQNGTKNFEDSLTLQP